jgi:hypothetical protein
VVASAVSATMPVIILPRLGLPMERPSGRLPSSLLRPRSTLWGAASSTCPFPPQAMLRRRSLRNRNGRLVAHPNSHLMGSGLRYGRFLHMHHSTGVPPCWCAHMRGAPGSASTSMMPHSANGSGSPIVAVSPMSPNGTAKAWCAPWPVRGARQWR